MRALGDVDRLIDPTVHEGNSCGRDCVEGERSRWNVSYNMRRAVSKARESERHLESSHTSGVNVHGLVNDNVDNPRRG